MGSDPAAPRFMFTARLEIKYRKNVPIGVPLRIVGKAGRSRTHSAEAWAGIYDSRDGTLLAEADSLMMDVPADQFNVSDLDRLGWRVYPD
jgi:acyl-CoA thioesterase FadM